MSNPSGTWDLSVNTPFGAQALRLEIVVDGSDVHGTATHESGSMDFTGGTYENDEVTFEVTLTAPVTADLKVTLRADDNLIQGKAKAGMLGFDVEGHRVA